MSSITENTKSSDYFCLIYLSRITSLRLKSGHNVIIVSLYAVTNCPQDRRRTGIIIRLDRAPRNEPDGYSFNRIYPTRALFSTRPLDYWNLIDFERSRFFFYTLTVYYFENHRLELNITLLVPMTFDTALCIVCRADVWVQFEASPWNQWKYKPCFY